MKIFIAGATGAIGKRLIPLLVEKKHEVFGMTRSQEKSKALEAQGAKALLADALDKKEVMAAVMKAKPEVIIHQLTALSSFGNIRKFDQEFALTNRLRTEGTDYLLAAARAAGVRRFVAQSYTGWPYARDGKLVKTEEEALDPNPPFALRNTLNAIRYLESVVRGADGMEGIVLRYGGFYGPGTSLSKGKEGVHLQAVQQRKFPIVGKGTGVWSFIHIDDAARATLAAIESGSRGVYNIVDDEPAPVSEWLPALAATIGTQSPRHVPAWLARFIIGDHGVVMMTQIRGASNAKAKRELDWKLRYPSWRQGFLEGLG